MKGTDVIIIGAGAAGLMAAHILVKAGKTVTILEARDRIGGRIHTIKSTSSSQNIEMGAEFIHGNLPVTLNLLKEAGIKSTDVSFKMWQYHNDTFKQSEEFVEGWHELLEKLDQLREDMPLHDFLIQYFPGDKYANMRAQVENYVAGYDTADVREVSAFGLRNEWKHEDEDAQHRINGGYARLVQYLADICYNSGNAIVLNAVARKISWKNNAVEVTTTKGISYEALQVIIAMPLGVLQAPEDAEGALIFNPPLPKQFQEVHNIGFGSVIKILLEFDDIFWRHEAIKKVAGADLSALGFLFTDEVIPTFWTQEPLHVPLLTGWLGGPPAYTKKDLSPGAIMELAIASLSNIFKIAPDELKAKIVSCNVSNWTAEPYTRGSYAYDKIKSPHARKILRQPVEETIYFAGEYLYDGPAMGTVEAALTSGKHTAEMLLKGKRYLD